MQDSNKNGSTFFQFWLIVLPVYYYASALIFAYNCFLTK